MKTKIVVVFTLISSVFLALLFIANAQHNRQARQYPVAEPSLTIEASTHVSPTPNCGAPLLTEMRELEEQYNILVQTVQPPSLETPSGQEGSKAGTFELFESPLLSAWDDLVTRVQDLNQEYYSLLSSEFDVPDIPLPPQQPLADAQVESLLSEAGENYRRWLEQETRTGSFLSLLYDPYEGRPQVILVGDSFIQESLRWQALMDFRLALTAPPLDQLQRETQTIQILFPGEVELTDVGQLLPPYTADDLHEYRSGTWRVIIHPSTLRIMLIDVDDQGEILQHGDVASCPQLTAQKLSEQAIAFIQLASPTTNIASLSSLHNQKGLNYFFRWEDQDRPLLPDGRSFPFVQVAIDACGNLLNYYNTL